MRYASIRSMDISNGKGVGVSLFVQGCPHHCYNCFNPETWDFNGGKEWTQEVEDKFLELVSQPFVSRVSFLGGEPLVGKNVSTVSYLINKIKKDFPYKKIWLWTGYNYDVDIKNGNASADCNKRMRWYAVSMCDYLIDGKYVDELKDLSLVWRGSSNQRVIDVKKTIEKGGIILYE